VSDHTLQHCYSECHIPAELTCHKMYNKVYKIYNDVSVKHNIVYFIYVLNTSGWQILKKVQ